MERRQAILLSTVINAFFLFLCFFWGKSIFGAIDDYFMARLLEGVYGGDYNTHLTFINDLFGYALLPFYHLAPAIGWYYIAEVFAVFLSFTVIGYVLIRMLGPQWGSAFETMIVAALASDYYLVMQFTQCASVLTAAGILLYLYKVRECDAERFSIKKIVPFVFPIFLIFWGSLMRWDAFLMGMPFFALAILLQMKKIWRIKGVCLASLAILVIAIMGAVKFNESQYASPEYKYFMDFQKPRAALGDGNNYNDMAIYEELEETGYYGADFGMLRVWEFYDNKVFSLDYLNFIQEKIKYYTFPVNLLSMPAALIGTLYHSAKLPVFWAWFALCAIGFWAKRKTFGTLKLWTSLLMVLGGLAYLLYVGRLVYRVENGLWLYASVFVVTTYGKLPQIPVILSELILLIFAISNIFIYANKGTLIRNPNDASCIKKMESYEHADYAGFWNYVDSLKDSSVFLVPLDPYMALSYYTVSPYEAAPKGSWRRIIPIGFWTPHFPDIEKSNQAYGVFNPLGDAVKENVYVVNNASLAPFLERHYYDDVDKKLVREFDGLKIYKYFIVKKEGEE